MKILYTLLEISVYSAAIILFIVVIKKVLGKRMTAAVQFSLWALLILRLLIPFSLESGLHLVKVSAPIEPPTVEAAAHESVPNDYQSEPNFSYAPATDSSTTDNNIESTSQQQPLTRSAQQETSKQTTPFKPTLSDILIAVWLVGVLAMLVFMALTYIRLRQRIQNSATILVPENVQTLIGICKSQMNVRKPVEVMISGEFESTMLLAALRPKLIIPVSMIEDQNDEVLKHCLLHEFAHCKRRDYLWYLLINVLCAVYWFNPAVWLGIRLMKQDMEAACDAHVVRTMTDGERNRYAVTLLSMFTNQTKRFQIAMGMGIAAKKEAAKRLRGIYMKRKMKFRTKLTIAILVLLVLFTCFTTACKPVESISDIQETPQNSSVQNDADEDVLAKLSFETPTEPYTAPQHWTETIEEGNLTIEIDTDITLPEVTKYPVARVEPITLTQDLVDELVEYFAPNSTIYEWPRPMTKADYEKWIERTLEDVDVDSKNVEDETMQLVALLEKEQASAPIEAPKVYVDTTLTYPILDPNEPRDIAGGRNFLSVAVERSGQKDPMISVANAVDDYNDRVYFCYIERQYASESHIDDIVEEAQHDTYQTQTLRTYSALKNIVDSITLAQEEAQPQSDKVLSDLGITYMRLVNVEKAAAFKSFDEESDLPDEDAGGYVFEYIRDYRGMVGYERKDWNGDPLEEPPIYVEPYNQEVIKIFVTEKGVQSFIWSGGVRVTEEISDSVKLLPFDQIKPVLKKQISNKHTASLSYGDVVKVKVVSAELKLGYISADDSKEVLMVPVWVFSTIDIIKVYNYQTEDFEVVQGNHNLIVINAIDGGTIDISIQKDTNS